MERSGVACAPSRAAYREGPSIAAEISKTVANAVALLGRFSREEPSQRVAALARALELSRTSVLRLLATLEKAALVERDADGGYRLGFRALDLGSRYLASNPVASLLAKALAALVEETECTAYLGTIEDDDAVILMCHEGSLPVRFLWQAGSRLPVTTTALGKAILMHWPEPEVASLFAGRPLRALTPNSLRSYEALVRDLGLARRRGWALVREESHAGLTAVGAAVVDASSRPIAGLSLSWLDSPPDPARRERLASLVCHASAELSASLSRYRDYGVRIPLEVNARGG